MNPATAWAGRSQWRVLQAGDDEGRAFDAARAAWQDDAQRPRLLHWVAILPAPSRRWAGLTPGCHRFSFERGRVLLTLCVGELQPMLREQAFRADALVLEELAATTLKPLARLCRRGSTVTWTRLATTPNALAGLGFVLDEGGNGARYAPHWQVKGLDDTEPAPARDCIVIGAGLAGAAVAASLARRGSHVEVLDAAATPAGGASSLPAGLLAPHQSPDDNLLSRLSRCGVRMTLQECERLLVAGQDWAATGALEDRGDDHRAVPAVAALAPWTCEASTDRKRAAGLAAGSTAWWHATAAWVKPAALVRAWLAQDGVRFRGGCAAQEIVREGSLWCVRDGHGNVLARASLVVVAAAGGSAGLLPGRADVRPVRGQVSWNLRAADAALPPTPVNGNGHFLPDVPLPEGRAWLTGSTYGRADADPQPRVADHAANLERLRGLVPEAAAALAPEFAAGAVRAWSNVRWTSTDRRPLAGEIEPGLWLSTAMGSRGLTFATLCGEWIAARLHGEPWPLEARLAQSIDVSRPSQLGSDSN